LFAGQPSDDWSFRTALAAALAAEDADRNGRRNTRGRVAYLLCELGHQLARLRVDRNGDLPLSRMQIADALGVSLCRVKRTLALLSLSQVVAVEDRQIRVLDWRRLRGVGGYDRARLGLQDEDYEAALITRDEHPRPSFNVTASGDPACFV
jgi:hypothetical protein